jgi:hypothetical protein
MYPSNHTSFMLGVPSEYTMSTRGALILLAAGIARSSPPGKGEPMKKKIDEQTIIEAGNSICEGIAELIEAAKLLGIDVEKYLNQVDDDADDK